MAETYQIAIIIEGKDRASRPLMGVGGALRSVGQIAGGILAARLFERLASGVIGLARQALSAVTDYERLGLALQALSARELLALNHGERFTQWMKANAGATDYQISRYTALRGEYDRLTAKMKDMVVKGQDQTEYYQSLVKRQSQLRKQIEATIPGFDKMSTAMKKAALGGLDMSTALRNAIAPSKELLKWSIQLAIHSPFSTKGVVNAMKTAMAYGFTMDMAKNLTKTMIDFAAATGASGEVMDRIALALGQVKAKGRLMGQEILQLVNAGVPVNDILAEMGYNLNDVKKKGVGAQEFIEGFTKYMRENFGGAAARQTETWAGLVNTFGDLKELGLKSLFEGMFSALKPLASEFATWLQQEGLDRLHQMGKRIGEIFKLVVDLSEANWDDVMVGFRHIFGWDIGKAAKVTGFLRDLRQKWEDLGAIVQQIDIGGLLQGAMGFLQDLASTMDLSGLIAQVQGVFAVFSNSAPAFQEAIAQTLGYLKDTLIPEVEQALGGLSGSTSGVLASITEFWQEHGDQVIAIVQGILQALLTAFTVVFDGILTVVSVVLQLLSGTIQVAMALIRGDWSGAWNALKDEFIGIWNTIKGFLGRALKSMFKAAGTSLDDFLKVWGGVFDNLFKILDTWAGDTFTRINGWADDILGFFNGLAKDLKKVGKDIIQGLWDGMKSIWESVKDWLSDSVSTLLKIVQLITGTHSPSRKFAEIGKWWMEGLAQGIRDAAFQPQIAIAGAAVGAMGAGASQTWNMHFHYGGQQMSEDDIVHGVNVARFLAGG